jgi:putative transposase
MDGQGRYLDLATSSLSASGRSFKQEAIYLTELRDGFQAMQVIEDWVRFYNTERPHSALGYQTPLEACWADSNQKQVA